MNAAQCEFAAGNEEIFIVPAKTETAIHLICGDVGPFDAGVQATVPLWLAMLMKEKQECTIVPPEWISVEQLKKLLINETESDGLSILPKYFFEIAHILVRDAKDDLFEVDQVKSLVQDIYDKRDAKLRTSVKAFLSQSDTCHAKLDGLQSLEAATNRATLDACKQMFVIVRNRNDATPK